MIKGWKYYNNAIIPDGAPHNHVETTEFKNSLFWKTDYGRAYFARYTTDFDCGHETNWWYVIKDTPFDISLLKSKRRYEINKGKKNFDVRLIKPENYAEELFFITEKAYEQYPSQYRPNLQRDIFVNDIKSWEKHDVFGAFQKETGKLCGYAWLHDYGDYIDFCMLKVDYEYEKLAINAALVASILDFYAEKISEGVYICDGARSSLHETKFQDYLEKYFQFRKAYCNLKMKYRFPINYIVKFLFPFRAFFIKSRNKLASKIGLVLELESIARGINP